MLEIYTKPACPICNQAKDLLNSNHISYKEIRIGTDVTRETVISNFPSAKTVPIILLNGMQIAGLPELSKMIEKGQLNESNL